MDIYDNFASLAVELSLETARIKGARNCHLVLPLIVNDLPDVLSVSTFIYACMDALKILSKKLKKNTFIIYDDVCIYTLDLA